MLTPIALVLSAALSTATPQVPQVSNLYNAAGTIASIENDGEWFHVDVRLDGFGMPYDGHIYTIDLSPGDMTDWLSEQGPVCTGDRVFCWMDSRRTASVLDDAINHIRK